MDIEQTKRMNFMIKELTKSGMVSSFDDAIDTASGLYHNAMPEDKKPEAPPVEEETQELPVDEAETTYEKVQEELKSHVSNAIKNNNVDIAKSMQKIWDEVQSLKREYQKELQALKQDLKAPEPAPKKENLNNYQEDPHPRQGDYAPDNVVLENYFYCGQR